LAWQSNRSRWLSSRHPVPHRRWRRKALDFYQQVFGATEQMRMPAPNGRIGHAEMGSAVRS
jgi:hypothetical protein